MRVAEKLIIGHISMIEKIEMASTIKIGLEVLEATIVFESFCAIGPAISVSITKAMRHIRGSSAKTSKNVPALKAPFAIVML